MTFRYRFLSVHSGRWPFNESAMCSTRPRSAISTGNTAAPTVPRRLTMELWSRGRNVPASSSIKALLRR